MSREGKITAAREDIRLPNEKFDPWLLHPFSPSDLEKTVNAFNRLATAIESRMPTPPPPPSTNLPSSLLDNATLTAANIPQGSFVHSFLTSARRPRCCRFIAPGLLIPDAASFISSQRFTSIPNDDEDCDPVPPVLLFHAAEEPHHLDPNAELENPFIYDYNEAGTIPAGLYLGSINRRDFNIAEDGFRLLLPLQIGSNGLAKRSDGSEVESAAQLYQHGFQSFGGDAVRAQRLVKLFENWLGMVERGDWEVGAEGVLGGIAVFQEADSARWRSYWIEPSW